MSPQMSLKNKDIILYYDEHLIIANKPHGVLSVPGPGDYIKKSLLNSLQEDFEDALIVHRLDMATSGLMVYARGKEAHRSLSISFMNREVDKIYIARAEGIIAQDEGEIDFPLIKDWPNRPKQKIDYENGKPCHTFFKILARGYNETRVELKPITGRSHQLRMHLMGIGHPILGDAFYNPEHSKHERLMLHASYLSIPHPFQNKKLEFELEPDF